MVARIGMRCLVLGMAVSMVLLLSSSSVCRAQTVAPGWESPRTVNKLLKYSDAYLMDPNAGGTCNFGNGIGVQGVLMAANTALYADDVAQIFNSDQNTWSSAGCGICYKIVGPEGSVVVMNADICNDNSACTQYQNGYSFNLYNGGALKAWDAVMPSNSGQISAPTGVTIQQVSCPLSYFTKSTLQAKWRAWSCCGDTPWFANVQFTLRNYRVKITQVSGRPEGSTIWTALKRSWTNEWLAEADTGVNFDKDYELKIDSVTNTIYAKFSVSDLVDLNTGKSLNNLPSNTGTGGSGNNLNGVFDLHPLESGGSLQFDDFDGGSGECDRPTKPKTLTAEHDSDGLHLKYTVVGSPDCQKIDARAKGSKKWLKLKGKCHNSSKKFDISKSKLKEKLGGSWPGGNYGTMELEISVKSVDKSQEKPCKSSSKRKKTVSVKV
eukprot:TRINITY_DN4736_c0_g1_i1.p1 TRINITY_DN4736_c0_g1~~TRINITY_DN4736_c0_g1_i1.p1  ORF type:complete len:465 (+),score=92.57 TRINITY_DN4736_c0_g1_i1:90-1397(+)